MATRNPEPIRLAGPPHRTAALVPLAAGTARVATVAVELADGVAVQKAYLRRFGADATEVRLRLPRETPPGSYRAELALGDRKTAITVEVAAREHLRVQPQRTHLTVPPGGHAEFTVVLENRGNVPFDVPAAVGLDVDDALGQELALGRALRADLKPGEPRVERFFEELRAVHGGEAKVVVLAGAGALRPAESRTLECRVELPATARPGRTYSGAWLLGDAGCVLELEVTDATPVIRKGRPQ